MISHSVRAGIGKHSIEAVALLCGGDLSVTICGGETWHIGAAALAAPRPSLKDPEEVSASASVICLVGHKEDEVARHAALELATTFSCNVNVAVGIHVDNATKADLAQLWENYKVALNLLKEKLRKHQYQHPNP